MKHALFSILALAAINPTVATTENTTDCSGAESSCATLLAQRDAHVACIKALKNNLPIALFVGTPIAAHNFYLMFLQAIEERACLIAGDIAFLQEISPEWCHESCIDASDYAAAREAATKDILHELAQLGVQINMILKKEVQHRTRLHQALDKARAEFQASMQ